MKHGRATSSLTIMTQKDKVQIILNKLSKIDKDKIPTHKNGQIDMTKIMEVKEFREAIDELKALRIKGDWLVENGFMPAHLLISKYL